MSMYGSESCFSAEVYLELDLSRRLGTWVIRHRPRHENFPLRFWFASQCAAVLCKYGVSRYALLSAQWRIPPL
jgi:hypothetical protein